MSLNDLNPSLFKDVLTVNTNRSSLDVMWFDRFWVKKSQLQSLCPNLLPFPLLYSLIYPALCLIISHILAI